MLVFMRLPWPDSLLKNEAITLELRVAPRTECELPLLFDIYVCESLLHGLYPCKQVCNAVVQSLI